MVSRLVRVQEAWGSNPHTPTKGKRHDVGRAFFLWPEDGTCSGEMNSPCAEGLGTAQTPRDGVPDAAGPVGRFFGCSGRSAHEVPLMRVPGGVRLEG